MSTVVVSNIAPQTTEAQIQEFFSFCGKITDIQVTEEGDHKTATVSFEKETAQKTALLLNNTQLGTNAINVHSSTGNDEDDGSHYAQHAEERTSDHIEQEEKPRSRILAEYLAHGYVVGDAALQRALELDQKHGVSPRFLATLQRLEATYHPVDRAVATNQTYGLTEKAGSILNTLSSYFERATETAPGRKLVHFYSAGSRQVQDIHVEAKRLASLKKEAAGGSAYKAAGLERVFGKEAPGHGTTAETATPTPAVPTSSDSQPQA